MSRIAVFGAGVAGSTFIKAMAAAPADITLVDPKDYMELPFATLRALVDPTGFGMTVRRPIAQQLQVRHIRAKLSELREHSAVLDNGGEIDFDFAVVATGSAIRGFDTLKVAEPRTQAEREAEWAAEHDRLAAADSVVIVGGGPIGVELAGEITDTYPAKRLALVQGADRLLPALSKRAGEKAQRVLERRGVRVVLGQKATVEENGRSVRLASGETLTGDVVYTTTGIAIDTSYLEAAFPHALDGARRARVDRFLRLVGSDSIFALGDINNVPGIKLGAWAAREAKLTARNISALVADRRLRPYHPLTQGFGMVTLGRKAGIAELAMLHFDAAILVKQRDLFLGRYFKRPRLRPWRRP